MNWHLVDVPLRTQLRSNLFGQACVRLGICAFMALYFAVTGHLSEPLYQGFVVYAILSLLIARQLEMPLALESLAALTAFTDHYFTLYGLHLTGADGYFLFIILIQLSFGYGIRYGTRLLWCTVVLSCSGVAALYLFSPFWTARPRDCFAFFIGVPFIALYIAHLIRTLRESKNASEREADRNARLLRFVSHDIRTQLQALLFSIEAAGRAPIGAHTRTALQAARGTVDSLARITTQFAAGHEATAPEVVPAAVMQELSTGRVGAWLGDMLRRFEAAWLACAITVRVELSGVPVQCRMDWIACERLFANALANAVRFSRYGTITVTITGPSAAASSGQLRIVIVNHNPQALASSDTVSEHAPMYGAGVGLQGCAALAEEIGGSFNARQIDERSFRCEFSAPFLASETLAPPAYCYPVLVVSHDREFTTAVSGALEASCNPIAFQRWDSLDRDACGAPVGAFIDARALPARPEELPRALPQRMCSVVVGTAERAFGPLPGRVVVSVAAARPELLRVGLELCAAYVRARRMGDSGDSEPGTALAHRAVLLVDDNRFNTELAAHLLRQHGAAIDTADSVEKALAMLQATRYDAIVVDWNIAGQNPLRIVDYLAREPAHSDATVVILSAENAATIRAALAGRTVAAIVGKPVDARTIVRAIGAALAASGKAERRTGFAEHAPSDWLRTQDYRALAARGVPGCELAELLDALLDDLDRLVAALQAAHDAGEPPAELARRAHAVKSVAESGGALVLGRLAHRLSEAASPGAASRHGRLEAIVDAWAVTAVHVRLLQLALRGE